MQVTIFSIAISTWLPDIDIPENLKCAEKTTSISIIWHLIINAVNFTFKTPFTCRKSFTSPPIVPDYTQAPPPSSGIGSVFINGFFHGKSSICLNLYCSFSDTKVIDIPCTGTRCTTTMVHIILSIMSKYIKINNQRNININSTRHDISSYQHRHDYF